MSASNAKYHFRKAKAAAESNDTPGALKEICEGLQALADAVGDVERKVQDQRFHCRAK